MDLHKMAAALHMLADALVSEPHSRVEQLINIAKMPAVRDAEANMRVVQAVINLRAGGEAVDLRSPTRRPIVDLNGKAVSLFEAKSAFDYVYRSLDYSTLVERVAE